MSAKLVISILVVNVMLVHGLELFTQRDTNYRGEKTLCAQLHCVEDATSESEISSLVNMSVYRMVGDGKIPLATISANDPRVREYNVDGTKVDGKISTKAVEMTVSITQQNECQAVVWACDVHYIDLTGHIMKKENKTSSGSRNPRSLFLDLNLKSQGLSEISLSFKDLYQFKDADLNMKLRLSDFNSHNNNQGTETSFDPEKQSVNPVAVDNKKIMGKHGKNNKSTKQLTKQNKDFIYEDINTKSLENNENDLLRTVRLQEEQMNNVSLLLSALNESYNIQQEHIEKIEQELTEEINQLKDAINLLANPNSSNLTSNLNLNLFNLSQLFPELKKSNQHLNKSVDNLALIVNIMSNNHLDPEMMKKLLVSIKFDLNENKMTEMLLQNQCSKFTNNSPTPHEILTSDINTKMICDSATDGGGWIIIQRRVASTLNYDKRNYRRYDEESYGAFHVDWNNYKFGFGDLSRGYWLGNEWISRLTSTGYTDLRIDMTFKGKHYYVTYSNFTVGNEKSRYKMSYSSYKGNATDGLKDHNGMNFSTYDIDNDQWSDGSCAKSHSGGWWFNNCLTSNLNGVWASKEFGKGVNWENVTGWRDSLEFTEMKLRLP